MAALFDKTARKDSPAEGILFQISISVNPTLAPSEGVFLEIPINGDQKSGAATGFPAKNALFSHANSIQKTATKKWTRARRDAGGFPPAPAICAAVRAVRFLAGQASRNVAAHGHGLFLAQTFTSGTQGRPRNFHPPAHFRPLKGPKRKRAATMVALPTGVNAWASAPLKAFARRGASPLQVYVTNL